MISIGECLIILQICLSKFALLRKHNKSGFPWKLLYNERSVFNEYVITENISTFESGIGNGINEPPYVLVGLQKRNHLCHQNIDFGLFYRPTSSRVHCNIGKQIPDANNICDSPIEKLLKNLAKMCRVLKCSPKKMSCNFI